MTVPKTFSKRDFSCGQYDREYQAAQSDVSARGMSFSRNLMSSLLREVKTRPGTKWQANLSDEAVIIPFRRAEKDLALIFQESTLDVYENVGGVLVPFRSGVISTVVWNNTSNFEPESTPVSVSGDVSGNIDNFYNSFRENTGVMLSNYLNRRLFIEQQKYPTVYFGMEFANGKALQKVEMELLPADGNFNQPNFSATKNWVKDAVLQYSDDNLNWTTVRLAAPWKFVGSRQDTPNGIRNVNSIRFQPLITESHRYWRIQVVFDRGQMLNNAPICVNFYDNVQSEVISEHETWGTVYTRDNLRNLKYSQQYNEMYICDGIHTPYKFSMIGSVPTLTTPFQDDEGNPSVPFDTDGMPSCVQFYQNRLWFAGFAAFPTRVRASQFNDFSNFIVPTSNITVASPIAVDGAQIKERITDLFGGFEVMTVQSPDGISQVFNADPANINFTLKCYEKASGITPTVKDNILFYVGLDKNKIYAFAYDKLLEQFVAPDVSQYGQDVLKDKIAEIMYVDSRNRNIIGVLENGKMFSMLYDKSGILGYFPWDVGAEVYDISSLKDGSKVELFLTMRRNGQWVVEKIPAEMIFEETDGFEQEPLSKNTATKDNLFERPYFDGWKTLKNEVLELWEYDRTTKILAPSGDNLTSTPLSPFLNKAVRFFYGDGIDDYVSLEILKNFTETQTYETEESVVKNVQYYGWTFANSITVSGISGQSPQWNGTFTRRVDLDGTSGKSSYKYAWVQGSYIGWTTTPNPSVGGSLYAVGARALVKGIIQSVVSGTVLTQTSSPIVGSNVYNTSYEQVGTATAGSSSAITYNGQEYLRYSGEDAIHPETVTEIVTHTIETGYYEVQIEESGKDQDYLFTKLQKPIESITGIQSKIQIQDNGVYCGTFEPVDGIVDLKKSMYNIQYGYPYRKIGVIQDNANYLRRKKWGAIAVNVMDTMSLKIGSKIDKLQDVILYKGQNFYNSSPIMQNGILVQNIKDAPEFEKNLIFVTDEGLPFCIRAIEASGEITDRNTN